MRRQRHSTSANDCTSCFYGSLQSIRDQYLKRRLKVFFTLRSLRGSLFTLNHVQQLTTRRPTTASNIRLCGRSVLQAESVPCERPEVPMRWNGLTSANHAGVSNDARLRLTTPRRGVLLRTEGLLLGLILCLSI